ncbi:MAG: hypothetical protein QM726_11465 [Chitinophagaceae bacterium]
MPVENTFFEKITALLVIVFLACLFILKPGILRMFCDAGLAVVIFANILSKTIRFWQFASKRTKIIWAISLLLVIYGQLIAYKTHRFNWSYLSILGVVVFTGSFLVFYKQLNSKKS